MKQILGIIVLVQLTLAQNINLSGIVKDSITQASISNAKVTLLMQNISDTTDRNGNFHIKLSSVGLVLNKNLQEGKIANLTQNNGIKVHHAKNGILKVQIFNIQGKLVTNIIDKHIDKGYYTFQPPSISTGYYMYVITSHLNTYTIPFIQSSKTNLGGHKNKLKFKIVQFIQKIHAKRPIETIL